MPNAAPRTLEELRALGYEVRNGVAVRISGGPPPLAPSVARAWPEMRYDLPRPRSLAKERDEQAEICRIFRRHGCSPRSTSQYRPSKQALGIPDLWVFGPTTAWWFEVKSGEDWRFSEHQLQWARDCMASGILYGAGDRWAALALLKALGIASLESML